MKKVYYCRKELKQLKAHDLEIEVSSYSCEWLYEVSDWLTNYLINETKKYWKSENEDNDSD